ncbi:MAG: hypothetical protein ACKVS6_10730 [Planctomycetota bacterium]
MNEFAGVRSNNSSSMFAAFLKFTILLSGAIAQDGRSPDPAFEYLLSQAPKEIRPPVDPSQRTKWAAEILLTRNEEALTEAATRILAIDIPRSIDELERLSVQSSWRVRAAALDAGVRGAPLAKEGRDQTRLRSIAVKASTDSARLVRKNAARLIAEVGDSAQPVLDVLSRDAFYDVRLEAVRALVRNGATITMPWIAERLRDSDKSVAELAVDVLPRLGSGGAIALAPFVEDRNSPLDLRLRALMSLRNEGTADGLDVSLLKIVTRLDEPRELRALALALALTVGGTFDPPEAVELLLPIALESQNIEYQLAAIEGLVSLGPFAAVAIRESLVKQSVPLYVFQKVLSALPKMARKDATQELKSFFDALSSDRDDERAIIARTLGRVSPSGLSTFFIGRINSSGSATRYEIVKAFLGRDDVSDEIVNAGLLDKTPEVRRVAFDLALRSTGVPTRICVDAIERETSPYLRSEFVETLSRRRPDSVARDFLLKLLRNDESDVFESVAAALDVYEGDADVLAALIDQHDKAYQRQIEDTDQLDESAWRIRRMAIRTISRIGGEGAVDFLKLRIRTERAVDEDLAVEAVKGLGILAPEDPILIDILLAPSLPKVRIEAAIITAQRGKGQGVRTLAREIRSLDGDMRRRALDALAKGQAADLRRGFLEVLAKDEKATFDDDHRSDAIRDLATIEDIEALKALAEIAKNDRSTDSKLEAIYALGRRGSDAAATHLVELSNILVSKTTEIDSNEMLLQGIALALGNSKSSVGVPRLLCHLFERPLKESLKHLLDPDASRLPFERRRRYDREREASKALTKLSSIARQEVASWIWSMKESGQLALVDPTFLLDIADEWADALPEASAQLSDVAGTFGQDLDPRFRACVNRALVARDRRVGAAFFEAAGALAASGAVDKSFARILGGAEAASGRRPRVWLRCVPLIARADAAFAVHRDEEAVRFLDEAQRRGEQDARTLMDIAASFHARGMLQKAREVVGQVVQLAPSDPLVCETYAWFSLENGDHDTALKHFRLAETLDEEGSLNKSIRIGTASALASLNRNDEACVLIRSLLRDDPGLIFEIRKNRFLGRVRELLHLDAK